jgi:hypothetical protein
MAISAGSSSIIVDGLVLHFDSSTIINYLLSNVEVLVVGGGGAGGQDFAGGGGGGGVVYNSSYTVTPGSAITVTVGNGGTRPSTSGAINGANSVFGNITAIGGGGGGGSATGNAGSGGSGGGGAYGYARGTGTSGQGYGGEAASVTTSNASGGGGAGGTGVGGNGGPGLPFTISGSLRYYGGGGGGCGGSEIYYKGGLGGGGTSSGYQTGDGVANTGGGGGAYYGSWSGAGSGGSGVVIVRYPGPQKATGGNTITSVNGYTIHTFTSSGTFTPLTTPANGGAVYGFQDLTGNNNTGNQSGGVIYSTANRGTFSFDGLNDYVDVTTNLGTLSAYTFCHWSRRDAENRMPIGWRTGPTFYQYGDNSWFYTHGGVTGEYYYPKSVSIPAGTWGFYCITYDGSAVRIYRNSVLEGSQSTTGTADWTNGLRIGYWAGGGSYWYQGAISIVSMYNKALTQAEISQNFNALRGRFGL